MKNWNLKKLLIISIAIFLSACGSTPQSTVHLDTNMLSLDGTKIGFVYVSPKENATTHIFGAGCLLCYGVASALTSSLDTYLKNNIDNSELENIKNLVVEEYSNHNDKIELIKLPKPIAKLSKFKGENGFAKKDFRPLKEELGLDIIVVLEINRHGAYRSFSNYIPNGDPQGHIAGLLYSVDLSSNKLLQYFQIDERVQPNGNWDEPEQYPSVTTSYYQAIENAKQSLRQAI